VNGWENWLVLQRPLGDGAPASFEHSGLSRLTWRERCVNW